MVNKKITIKIKVDTTKAIKRLEWLKKALEKGIQEEKQTKLP